MEKGFFTLLLLLITALSALAAPGNTTGPWGIDVSRKGGFTNLSTAKLSPATAGKTMVVSGVMDVSNLTIPDDRAVEIKKGGRIRYSGNLVINGPFNAGLYQALEKVGSGTIIFGSGSVTEVHPEWWGGKPNGINCTAAMNIAINLGIPVKLQAGTYRGNFVHTTGYLSITGAGMNVTKLQSETATGYAFAEEMPIGDWWVHVSVSDLSFVGTEDRLQSGFYFSQAALQDSAGRCEFTRVGFFHLDKGFHKPYGNIGNGFTRCKWRDCNYGYYAETNELSAILHAGTDTFTGGHFDGCILAALYINTIPAGGGQTILNDVIIEQNAGFGIFVYNYGGSYVPLVLNNIWNEGNATVSPVMINGVSYATSAMYFRNAQYVVLNGTSIPSIQLINSTTHETNCSYLNEVSSVDATSVRLCDSANVSYSNVPGGIVNSYGTPPFTSGSSASFATIPTRSTKVYNQGVKLIGESFSGAGPWAFNGTANINATTAADGTTSATCADIVIPTGHTEVLVAGAFTVTANKWYVYSMDIKLMTTAATTPSIEMTGDGAFLGNIASKLVSDKWVTVGGVQKAASTYTTNIPYITNSTGFTTQLRFANMQVIQFDTAQEALNYFNSGMYQ